MNASVSRSVHHRAAVAIPTHGRVQPRQVFSPIEADCRRVSIDGGVRQGRGLSWRAEAAADADLLARRRETP